jgi:peptidoglycan/LPS O-acetylase OafA/YrhL
MLVSLQALRALAAWLVVFHHFMQVFFDFRADSLGGRLLSTRGQVGVDIFFVLSGFVIQLSCAGRQVPGLTFLAQRLARIAPAYWLYTAITALILYAFGNLMPVYGVALPQLLLSLLFLPSQNPGGFGFYPILPVGWTLNFEMLFYVVFAAAIALGAPRVRHCLLVFLCVFVAARFLPDSVPLAFYAQSIIFEFIIGVAFAQMMLRWGAGPAGAGALLLAAGAIFTFGLGWDPGSQRLFPWGVGAAAIVLGTLWLERVIDGRPWAKPLAFLGDASYSIYLSHTFVVPACVIVLKKVGMTHTLVVFVLTSVAVVAAGSISYLWLEKPLIAVFKRLLFRTPRAVTPHAANTASN